MSPRRCTALLVTHGLACAGVAQAEPLIDFMPDNGITCTSQSLLRLNGIANPFGRDVMGVKFTPASDATVSSVDAYFSGDSVSDMTVRAEIWTSGPLGIADATTSSVLESGVSPMIPAGSTGFQVSIPFEGTAQLTAGTSYWMVFRIDSGPETGVVYVCENMIGATNPLQEWRWSTSGFVGASGANYFYGPAVRVNGAAAAPPCPADFDGESGLQIADIFAFLRAWFANAPSADFDQQNGIQVADIFAFLRAWFAGCP